MKIKTISLILIIFMIPVLLYAATSDKESSSAVVKFVLYPLSNFGYSTKPVSSITDEVEGPENDEVVLYSSADGSEMHNVSDLYAYWKINLNRDTRLKLILSIQEDMVNESGVTIPMTVEIAGGATITGKDSEYQLYEGVAKEPVYGSKLLKISCPVDDETRAGEYKGKLLLTLMEV